MKRKSKRMTQRRSEGKTKYKYRVERGTQSISLLPCHHFFQFLLFSLSFPFLSLLLPMLHCFRHSNQQKSYLIEIRNWRPGFVRTNCAHNFFICVFLFFLVFFIYNFQCTISIEFSFHECALACSQLIALSSFKSAFEWKTYAKYWRFIAATKQQHECTLVVDFIYFLSLSLSSSVLLLLFKFIFSLS